MKRIIISLLVVLGVAAFGFGQNTQTTKNTVDQTLRSSGRVNPSTLGMEFDLPLGSYPTRGSSLSLGLSYSSKVWRLQNEGIPTHPSNPISEVYGIYSEDAAAGWSSSLAQPYIEYTGMTNLFDGYGRPGDPIQYTVPHVPTVYGYYVRRITVFLPGGESHELRASDQPIPLSWSATLPPASAWEGTFYSTDGSGVRYVQDSASGKFRLYLSDGSFYDFTPGQWIERQRSLRTSYIRNAYKFTDVNGNFVQFNTVDTTGNLVGTAPYGFWTDQLGRVFPVMVPLVTPRRPSNVTEFSDQFVLPGMDLQNPYVLTWKRLASVFPDASYSTHYVGSFHSPTVYPNPLFDNQQLFPGSDCGFGDRSSAGSINSRMVVRPDNFENQEEWTGKFNPMVLAEIKLPNGAVYRFKYNDYGEIVKIEYPFGGREEFNYWKVDSLAGMAKGYQETNRGVYQRRVYEGSTDPMVYSYYSTSSDNNYRTTFTAPDGTKTDTFMHRGLRTACDYSDEYSYDYNGLKFGYDSALAGRTYETRTFSAGNQLIERTLTKWDASTPSPTIVIRNYLSKPLRRNARVLTTQTWKYDGTSAVTAATKFEYDSDRDEQGSPLNIVAQSEYAYESAIDTTSYTPGSFPPTSTVTVSDPTIGKTPIRITRTTYQTGPAYTDHNLLRLATQVLVTDGVNTSDVKSKSEVVYDEPEYLVNDMASGVPGWSTPEASPSPVVRGLATTSKAWPNLSGTPIVTNTQYNQFGNPRKTWDGNRNISEIRYDDNFSDGINRNTFAFATRIISAIPEGNGSMTAFETQTRYQFLSSLPDRTTDINGKETIIEYNDLLLRPTKVKAPNNQETVTQYGQPDLGTGQYLPSQRFVKVSSQIDDSNWKHAYAGFDGLGRTTRTQTVDNVGNGDVYVDTEYDNMSRVFRVSNPYCIISNARCSATPIWTTNTYDTAGRLWKVTAPESAPVVTTYGIAAIGAQLGTVTTVTDQAGKMRRSITDALGHLIRVDEPTTGANPLGTIDAPTQPTYYEYDLLSNLTKVKQGGTLELPTQTRQFIYDGLSRLISTTNPESGTINYAYDNNGNLTSKADARSIITTSTYDALNRVQQKIYSGGYFTPTVNYFYDNVTNAKGKLTKVSSSVSTTEYTSFDILGRVTGHKQTTDNTHYTTYYAYNLAGALIEETYPSGRKVQNVLNNNGDLSIVKSRKNLAAGYWNYASNFKFSATGALTSLKLGNGLTESTTFNNRLQPIQIALGSEQNPTNKLQLDYEYGKLAWNGVVEPGTNNGNVAKQKLSVQSEGQTTGFVAQQNYTYDELNRIDLASETLTPISGSPEYWLQDFDYDRFGNRNFNEATTTTLPRNCAGGTICPQDRKIHNPALNISKNQLSTADGYTFDAAGNMTGDPQNRSFTYDAENKQVRVDNTGHQGIAAGTVGQYFYDGDGKRVKKFVPHSNETTIFVYDAAGRLIAEYATNVSSVEDAKVAYLTNDSLGSPRINTDRDGRVISRHDYHPFGEEITTSQRVLNIDYAPDSIRKQFTGYERDDETDLDFAQARMYSNKLGRFTAPDKPLLDQDEFQPQSWNIYLYARNNPLKYVDISGEEIFYATPEIKAASDDLRLKSATYDNALKGFEGKDAPNLTLQFGDAGFDANGVDKATGLASTSILPERTIEDGSNMDANDPNAVPTITTKPAELKDATITIDNSIKDNAEKVAENLGHEVGHVDDARNNPKQYSADSNKTKAEKGRTPHDERPQEKRANNFEKTVMKEKKDYEKAEKKRLKEEKERQKKEKKKGVSQD
ncbi:MAG: RHS repeat domain-containing protein [Pyrinomonadaceae bacterium]